MLDSAVAQYAVAIAPYKTTNLATSLAIIASHSIVFVFVFVVFVMMDTIDYLRLEIIDAGLSTLSFAGQNVFFHGKYTATLSQRSSSGTGFVIHKIIEKSTWS